MPEATYQVRVSGVIPAELLSELDNLTVSVEPLMVGCDTTEHTKSTDVKSDGTVVKKETKTTQNPDGSVTKTETKDVNKPANP